MDPADRSRPADLLAELTRLHDLLSEPASDNNTIPLLQDVVLPDLSAADGPNLQHLRLLLMQSAEGLLQDVIRDFAPQITAELEKRLLLHLEYLIREQEQQNSSRDTPEADDTLFLP